MERLCGLDIVINDMTVPKYRTVPARNWHRRRNYANRVEKKWRKRFGVIGREYVIKTGSYLHAGRMLVMNSETLATIKKTLATAERSMLFGSSTITNPRGILS